METPEHDRPLPGLLVPLHNLLVAQDNIYYIINRGVKLVPTRSFGATD